MSQLRRLIPAKSLVKPKTAKINFLEMSEKKFVKSHWKFLSLRYFGITDAIDIKGVETPPCCRIFSWKISVKSMHFFEHVTKIVLANIQISFEALAAPRSYHVTSSWRRVNKNQRFSSISQGVFNPFSWNIFW